MSRKIIFHKKRIAGCSILLVVMLSALIYLSQIISDVYKIKFLHAQSKAAFEEFKLQIENKNETLPYLLSTVKNEFPELTPNADILEEYHQIVLNFKFRRDFSVNEKSVAKFKDLYGKLDEQVSRLIYKADSLNILTPSEYLPDVKKQVTELDARIFIEKLKYSRTVENFNNELEGFPDIFRKFIRYKREKVTF